MQVQGSTSARPKQVAASRVLGKSQAPVDLAAAHCRLSGLDLATRLAELAERTVGAEARATVEEAADGLLAFATAMEEEGTALGENVDAASTFDAEPYSGAFTPLWHPSKRSLSWRRNLAHVLANIG